MFGSVVLEVAIGLAFVYLLLALVCTAVNEGLAGWLKLRAKNLELSIQRLLGARAAAFYSHPLVRTLALEGKKPAYIPARVFALALMDLISGRPPEDVESLKKKVADLKEAGSDLGRSLEVVLADASVRATEGLLDAQLKIEDWFNAAMQRATGWYKRKTMAVTVGVACVVTIGMNADTLHIANRLMNDTQLRLRTVAAAEARAKTERPASTPASASVATMEEYKDAEGDLPAKNPDFSIPLTEEEKEILSELVGWSEESKLWNGLRTTRNKLESLGPWVSSVIPTHLFGWLITIFAISLGAPFWFDTLNRIINIRAGGKSPEEKKREETTRAS